MPFFSLWVCLNFFRATAVQLEENPRPEEAFAVAARS